MVANPAATNFEIVKRWLEVNGLKTTPEAMNDLKGIITDAVFKPWLAGGVLGAIEGEEVCQQDQPDAD